MEQQRADSWTRPDFEEAGSGFEVSAYTNDWDQDRI
jgi:coenzyme PQQ precursor peptide PqqA